MAEILVDDFDDEVRAKLLQRATQHGRTLNEEVLEILREAVKTEVLEFDP
jgi:plasmid stability protein